MTRYLVLSALLAATTAWAAASAESVTVGGTAFASTMKVSIDDKTVTMRITGAGIREKFFLNIYGIASYVQEGAEVKSASELLAADCPKCLHLVMNRGVNGPDMAEAFAAAIRLNHPAPALEKEVAELAAIMRRTTTNKGDHVLLTHVPGVGLKCDFAGQVFVIRNVEFARAVWSGYLGDRNLGDKLKNNLVSKL